MSVGWFRIYKTISLCPMGLGFMGLKWSEPALIEMAYAFEQRTQARKTFEYNIVVKCLPSLGSLLKRIGHLNESRLTPFQPHE
jgi:hypothetical protein